MITALVAASLAGLPPQHVRAGDPVFADARPAIWVVNDHDTVIYLFGTFHALDGQTRWFNDEVMTAFAGSDELVLETLVPQALPPQPPTGIGPVAATGSFLSTNKVVMSAGRSRGMSTANGADTVLRQAAENLGKPVGGLESFEFQLGMFSSMPAPAAPPTTQSPQTKRAMAALLARLQSAWERGDVESFAPMLEQMRTNSPETYRRIFADRNTRWAGWIAQRLQQPGRVFVAVGAGHLAGRDSIQTKLAQRWIRTARIN